MDTEAIFAGIHDVDCEDSKNDENCFCVQRCCFISSLYLKQHQESTLESELSELTSFLNGEFIINKDYTITNLLNDYHHLLSQHKNDLELIYSLLSTKCNVNECYLIKQNNDKNKYFDISNCNKLAIFNILDSIHRHLYHTFDFGFECTKKQQLSILENIKDMKNDKDNADIVTDLYLVNLKQHINIYTESLIKHKSNLKNNKFITIIDQNELKPLQNDDEKHDEIYSPEKASKNKHSRNYKHLHKRRSTFYNSQKYRTDDDSALKVYSFGKMFRYDICYKNDETNDIYNGGLCKWWYVESKYKDLKTEILQNTLYNLTINEWQLLVTKSRYLLKCEKCKVLNMEMGMELHNILSIVLYIDDDMLSKSFISTYRKLKYNESDKEWVVRHCEYGNLGKILKDTVNTFGSFMHKLENSFYHNISLKMVFKSTMINFLGPTSLTTSINSGLLYAYGNDNNGLLLNLLPYYCTQTKSKSISISTKIFECNWLCNFIGSQYEYLMIGNSKPVKTKTIILPKICHNYEYYLHAINILNLFINNKHSEIEINKKIFIAISNLITNQCLKYSTDIQTQRNLSSIPIYIDKLFDFFINSVRTNVTISIEKLMYNKGKKRKKIVYGYGAISDMFMNGNNLIDIDLILTLFRKAKKLKIWCKEKLELNDELINSFLNFLALQNISKIKEIDIIKPSETQITIRNIINKYKKRFMKLKWTLKENGKGVYPVLSIHKIKELYRAKSYTVEPKGRKKKKPYEIEHNLRPSLLPSKKSSHY